jgi:hypothetical protein
MQIISNSIDEDYEKFVRYSLNSLQGFRGYDC